MANEGLEKAGANLVIWILLVRFQIALTIYCPTMNKEQVLKKKTTNILLVPCMHLMRPTRTNQLVKH